MFKEVFGSEENKEAIAYLISEYFSLEYDAVLNNIKFKNTKLNINNEKDYKYDVDIIVSIDNETIVNLEANKSMWPGEEESLKKLSETDMMTKLYNRGYGEKKISEMQRSVYK